MSYITPEGYQRLSSEMVFLWKKKRPEIVRALADAAAEGDRSENAEYIYRKKELRETDRRLRYLERHLKDIKVVRDRPADLTKIYFGAWVRLEDDAGQLHTYRIVGGPEAGYTPGDISLFSPVAKALLAKSVDDEVTVDLPENKRAVYYVISIQYDPPSDLVTQPDAQIS